MPIASDFGDPAGRQAAKGATAKQNAAAGLDAHRKIVHPCVIGPGKTRLGPAR
jgi:hypothetical protein